VELFSCLIILLTHNSKEESLPLFSLFKMKVKSAIMLSKRIEGACPFIKRLFFDYRLPKVTHSVQGNLLPKA